MKSKTESQFFASIQLLFQDAAERDAAKEKVEQKMEVTLRHYKSMIWSIIILYIQGAEDEEGAEEGPWSGQMQAAMISEGLSRPAVTCAKWSNLVCSNLEDDPDPIQTYCSAIALKNYVIVDHCIFST